MIVGAVEGNLFWCVRNVICARLEGMNSEVLKNVGSGHDNCRRCRVMVDVTLNKKLEMLRSNGKRKSFRLIVICTW